MRTFLCYLFLLTLWGGCIKKNNPVKVPEHIRELENLTVYPFKPEAVPEIEMTRELRFGSTDEHFIGTIESRPTFSEHVYQKVAADNRGRVYISDFQQRTVHVYQPDGTWISDLGRQGNGPGEFEGISEIKVDSNNLYVIDTSQPEVEVFDLETLELSHTISLIPENKNSIGELNKLFPVYYYVRSDETVLIGFKKIPFQFIEDPEKQGPLLFYVLDHDGNLLPQKVLEQRPLPIFFKDSYYFDFPFIPTSVRAISNNDHVFAAWTADFLIKVYSPGGKYLRAFYYPFDRRPLVRSELREYGNLSNIAQQVISTMDLPNKWPAIRSLFMDDENRLWISTFQNENDDTSHEWWVMNKRGEMLGRVRLSKNQWLREVKNNRAYVIENETETGEQAVIRYRIEMSGT